MTTRRQVAIVPLIEAREHYLFFGALDEEELKKMHRWSASRRTAFITNIYGFWGSRYAHHVYEQWVRTNNESEAMDGLRQRQ